MTDSVGIGVMWIQRVEEEDEVTMKAEEESEGKEKCVILPVSFLTYSFFFLRLILFMLQVLFSIKTPRLLPGHNWKVEIWS